MPTPLTIGTGRALLGQNARPLLRDSFTDANGTALASHTPEVGGLWVLPNGGSWAIQSNKAVAGASAANQLYAVQDRGVSDVLLGVTVAVGAAGYGPGVVLRANGVEDNGYWVVVFTTGVMNLYEWNGATFTQRATAAGIAASTSYRLVVTAVGSTITGYLDGVQKWTYASATRNQTATQHGLHDSGTGAAQSTFDDLVVHAAGAVSVPGGVV